MSDDTPQDTFDDYATLCAVHTSEWDGECDVCRESADLCRSLLEGTQQQVTALEHKMMQQGAMLGRDMIAALKLDVLVKMTLSNKGRAYFDYLFQQRLLNEYETLLHQLTRMKIMQGGEGPMKGPHGGIIQ